MADTGHPDALTADATFAVVPTWVLDHPGLTPLAVRLYGVLARYVDNEGRCWPSRGTLAARLGCSRKSIDRATRLLISAGAVTVERRWEGEVPTSNLYRLHVLPAGGGRDTGVPRGRATGVPTVGPRVSHRTKAIERDNPPTPHHRPPWCGVCDDRTRLIDDTVDGHVSTRRCPTCHPLEVRHGS